MKLNKIKERCHIIEDCWVWQGAIDGKGYGFVSVDKEQWKTHRYVYYLTRKSHPGKLFVCHTCDNPSCVNPDHLWLGDNKANMIDCVVKGRNFNTRKKFCLRGHPLSGDNVYLIRNERVCRECARERVRKNRAKKCKR